MVLFFEHNARKEKLSNHQRFASIIDLGFKIEIIIDVGGSTIEIID